MPTQLRRPTGNDANTAAFTASAGNLYDCAGDAADGTWITGVTNGGGYCTFTFSAFTVPSTAVVSKLDIIFRFRSASTTNANTGTAAIKVGTTYTQSATSQPNASSGAILEITRTWTTNPATGAAWVFDEINGTDATTDHRLNAFGVGGDDFNPDVRFFDVWAVVTYGTATTTTATANLRVAASATRTSARSRASTALLSLSATVSRAFASIRNAVANLDLTASANYNHWNIYRKVGAGEYAFYAEAPETDAT